MKMNFENSNAKMSLKKKTVITQKVDKKWGHLPGFHVSFLSYGP